MRRLHKPPFWVPIGHWVDDEFISCELRSKLRELIPSDTPGELADAFMVRCSQQTQAVLVEAHATPPATQIAELRLIERRAHALLLALQNMSEEATAGFELAVDNLVFLTEPPFLVSTLTQGAAEKAGGLLGSVWDLTADLGSAAEYAASRVKASKQDKPKQQNARRLVFAIAEAYAGVFRRWPPIGSGWFQGFVERLGSHHSLSCGSKLVNGVLRAGKKREPKL